MALKKKAVTETIPVAPPAEVEQVIEPVKYTPEPKPSISAYPFKLIERVESGDGREVFTLEACAYGGNGIILRTSTRFHGTLGNVTACSESMCTVPGVSMSTFEGSRRGKKEL